MSGGSGRSILVVDDDAALRRRLVRAFADRGFRSSGAADGTEARMLLADESPEFAVLDLKLGRESGIELLKELLALKPDLKAVLLTGYGTIATAVEAVKLGAIQYLTKPVDADTILAAFDHPAAPVAEVETPGLAQVEWDHIQRVMDDCEGNITRASKVLGIHRRSLQRKLLKSPGPLR